MSKRLQVMITDDELREIQALARREKLSVAEWVRRALRKARQTQPRIGVQRKLEAVRSAITYEYPTADIDRMLGEIESGYGER
jgi:hypothetical protein